MKWDIFIIFISGNIFFEYQVTNRWQKNTKKQQSIGKVIVYFCFLLCSKMSIFTGVFFHLLCRFLFLFSVVFLGFAIKNKQHPLQLLICLCALKRFYCIIGKKEWMLHWLYTDAKIDKFWKQQYDIAKNFFT